MNFPMCLAAVLAVQSVNLTVAFAAPDPASAQAPALPVQYRSPFRDYHPLGEDKLIPWKAANDEVGKIGGWRVYAREAREPEGAPSSPAPATSVKPSADNAVKPAPGVHAGHGDHK